VGFGWSRGDGANIKKQVLTLAPLVVELILARLGMGIKEDGNHSFSENTSYSLVRIW
jgi:hypothetical protein